jgi:2-polyprenyl-6-methoxyphenol hydroxylase-like FAD-dependent oxidoreductase
LIAAIHAYEADMIRYGFAAVETSRRAMEQTLSTNAVQRAFSRLVFRAIEKLPAAKRWMFRRMAGREG